jgi:hypothetical protein
MVKKQNFDAGGRMPDARKQRNDERGMMNDE